MEPKRWFITVEYCANGRRGIFCDRQGKACGSDEQHAESDMMYILGLFWAIFDPKSESFTPSDLEEYTYWMPLPEYKNIYGIAYKEEQLNVSKTD